MLVGSCKPGAVNAFLMDFSAGSTIGWVVSKALQRGGFLPNAIDSAVSLQIHGGHAGGCWETSILNRILDNSHVNTGACKIFVASLEDWACLTMSIGSA